MLVERGANLLGKRKTKHRLPAVLAAIDGTLGNKAEVAERLQVTLRTVNRYLHYWPAARDAYEEEVERLGDLAERNIYDAIRAGDMEMTRWYAMRRLRDRGYAARTELVGAGGAPLYGAGTPPVRFVDVEPSEALLAAMGQVILAG